MVIFALALVIMFVLPAPIATGYICFRRPQVIYSYSAVMYVVSFILGVYIED